MSLHGAIDRTTNDERTTLSQLGPRERLEGVVQRDRPHEALLLGRAGLLVLGRPGADEAHAVIAEPAEAGRRVDAPRRVGRGGLPLGGQRPGVLRLDRVRLGRAAAALPDPPTEPARERGRREQAQPDAGEQHDQQRRRRREERRPAPELVVRERMERPLGDEGRRSAHGLRVGLHGHRLLERCLALHPLQHRDGTERLRGPRDQVVSQPSHAAVAVERVAGQVELLQLARPVEEHLVRQDGEPVVAQHETAQVDQVHDEGLGQGGQSAAARQSDHGELAIGAERLAVDAHQLASVADVDLLEPAQPGERLRPDGGHVILAEDERLEVRQGVPSVGGHVGEQVVVQSETAQLRHSAERVGGHVAGPAAAQIELAQLGRGAEEAVGEPGQVVAGEAQLGERSKRAEEGRKVGRRVVAQLVVVEIEDAQVGQAGERVRVNLLDPVLAKVQLAEAGRRRERPLVQRADEIVA